MAIGLGEGRNRLYFAAVVLESSLLYGQVLEYLFDADWRGGLFRTRLGGLAADRPEGVNPVQSSGAEVGDGEIGCSW